jgi:glycosyltransferase involved in cell wall biosynthesis
MKVSVLIPVYNCERYLAECLDSVLAQDLKDMEILISDDDSQDGTVDIIRQYAARDARIRWWQNPANLGQARNHNVCLQAARGEFIKFVHADDKFLQPSALSCLPATEVTATSLGRPSAGDSTVSSTQGLGDYRLGSSVLSRSVGCHTRVIAALLWSPRAL